MARHGENIRKRKDGRWEARYRFTDTERGRKIYRSVYGNTYDEAKKKRKQALQAAEKNIGDEAGGRQKAEDSAGSRIPLSQAAEKWLENLSRKNKVSTYVKYENVYRVHLERILSTCLLSDTSDPDFQKKISDHLSEKKLSDSIRKSICCVANQILAFAAGEYSVRIPVLKPAAEKQGKRPVETFTRPEQSRLFTCIYDNPDRFKTALLLCLYTGMRLGELCALKWEDVDPGDGTVSVNRTVQRIAAEGYATKTVLMETAPKSECSRRIIPLAAELMGRLEALSGDRPYVFGGDRPLEPRTMQYRFRKILKEAGIDDRNFHVLRHTFASNCVESGMDVKTLSVILGHSDVKITLNRYVHPTMDSKKSQMGRLPDFYGRIRGQAA